VNLAERVLRVSGQLALWTGYGLGLARRGWRAIRARLLPSQGWRTLTLGELGLQVPPGWGEIETTSDGGFVIHDRPRRFRVDGDAIWYSTAMELRIRRLGIKGLPRLAPMTEKCRTIRSRDGALVVALAVANGVGPKKRREGFRVLASVRRLRNAPPMPWPSQDSGGMH
jgi:hypothetical protein